MHAQEYDNLFQLIRQEPDAARYYAALPDYVRDMVSFRSSGFHSLDGLRDYTGALLRDSRSNPSAF